MSFLMFSEVLLITDFFSVCTIFIKKSLVKEKQSKQQWSEGEAEVLQVQ